MDDYCSVFDLTCRVPRSTIESTIHANQLQLLSVSEGTEGKPVRQVLKSISETLERVNTGRNDKPVRLCVPYLGSPQWGDIEPHVRISHMSRSSSIDISKEICYFLHTLRAVLRRYSNVCASVSLLPHMAAESWGGPGWIQKLGWLADACISLSAFTGKGACLSFIDDTLKS